MPAPERRSAENAKATAHQEQGDFLHSEKEIKIIEVGDLNRLKARLKELGAKCVEEEKILTTKQFRLNKKRAKDGEPESFVVPNRAVASEHRGELMKVLAMLRPALEGTDAGLGQKIKNWAVRLRLKDGEWYLTIKERRKQHVQTDDRLESVNIPVKDPEAVERFLTSINYAKTSERQKKRTRWEIKYPRTSYQVDLNQSPVTEAWLEIESGSKAGVHYMAGQLGYGQAERAAISETELYRRRGISDDVSKNIVFPEVK